jgi:hypothetical protein
VEWRGNGIIWGTTPAFFWRDWGKSRRKSYQNSGHRDRDWNLLHHEYKTRSNTSVHLLDKARSVQMMSYEEVDVCKVPSRHSLGKAEKNHEDPHWTGWCSGNVSDLYPEVLGSNLVRDNGYREWGFRDFAQFFQTKAKLAFCLINWAPRHERVKGSGVIVPTFLTSALGQLHASAALPLVSIRWEAGWAPDSVWTLRNRET